MILRYLSMESPFFLFIREGINRILAILLKCAMWDQFKTQLGVYPVILLDDAFAELDGRMKQQLMSLMENKTQILYASV